MSILKLKGNASGTGTVTLEAPNTNTDQTLNIPDGAGSFVTANASGDVAVTGDLTVDTDTLYVDSANNRVGVGTASPTAPLTVSGASPNVDVSDTGTSYASQDFLSNSGAARTTIGVEQSAGGGLFVGTAGYSAVFGSAGNHHTHIAANNTARMTLTNGYHSVGTLHLGQYQGTGSYDDPGFNGEYGLTFRRMHGTEPAIMVATGGRHYWYKVATGVMHEFVYKSTVSGSNVNVGNISTNGSSTSYNTSSDYRLKENVVDLTGASDRVNQIPVRRFNFITDPDTTVDGFLAHEVQTVVPEAITGTHNEVDEDGNPVYQGIDQSKLVPLLTAALQEALSEIADLKTRVAALETP